MNNLEESTTYTDWLRQELWSCLYGYCLPHKSAACEACGL